MARAHDVLILGAGPAGAAAAAFLAGRGAAVGLIHRPSPRPVGRIESLAPGIVPQLARIGVSTGDLTDRATVCPGTVSVWETATPTAQDYMLSPHGPAWSVDRARFDPWLRDVARDAGAEIVEARRVALDAAKGVSVDGQTMTAKTILIATGADTTRAPGRGSQDDGLVAIIGKHADAVPSQGDHRLFLEAAAEGWWYALRGPAAEIGFGLITDRETLAANTIESVWNRAAKGTRLIAPLRPDAVAGLVAAPVPCVKSHLSPAPNLYRVGNALAAYDPLTGRGVLEGIRSACDVAEQLSTDTADTAFLSRRLARGYAAYLEERRAFYHRAARRFGSGFWRRRVTGQAAFSPSKARASTGLAG